MKMVLVLLMLGLWGCASMIAPAVTPQQAAQMSSVQLCLDYSMNPSPTFIAALTKRHVLTVDELIAIQNDTAYIGERSVALGCTPKFSGYLIRDQHTVTDSDGTTTITTYADPSYGGTTMTVVWVGPDNKVTAIQTYESDN